MWCIINPPSWCRALRWLGRLAGIKWIHYHRHPLLLRFCVAFLHSFHVIVARIFYYLNIKGIAKRTRYCRPGKHTASNLQGSENLNFNVFDVTESSKKCKFFQNVPAKCNLKSEYCMTEYCNICNIVFKHITAASQVRLGGNHLSP